MYELIKIFARGKTDSAGREKIGKKFITDFDNLNSWSAFDFGR